jgi:fibrillarin-like rRNA methylase
VQTLFVEDNRQVPGKIDENTGNVVFDDLAQPDINDVLDDIARLVLKKGGTVIVLPTNYMPTSTGAAAILRY